jgi:hypothetical protein
VAPSTGACDPARGHVGRRRVRQPDAHGFLRADDGREHVVREQVHIAVDEHVMDSDLVRAGHAEVAHEA